MNPASNPERHDTNGRVRIAVTGGPGAGKTTAIDLFRRELGDGITVVPEAGTLLFSGGFPRSALPGPRKAAQLAIYHTQVNLEAAQAELYPDRVLLCDRGTLDGVAYWPDDGTDFFMAVGTTLERELARYDAVIFFETAAAGGNAIEGNNPIRNEGLEEAVALDRKLQAVWSQHPDFTFVPNHPSFFRKIIIGLGAIESRLAVAKKRNQGRGHG
ncbi:MAG TPA: ATP-binding protein [Myxococcota bacterium]|nr:ATP-binding protein [Myxococcota bacterium]